MEDRVRQGWIAQRAPWAIDARPFTIDGQAEMLRVRLGDQTLELEVFAGPPGQGWCRFQRRMLPVAVVLEGKRVHVWLEGHPFVFDLAEARPRATRHTGAGPEGLAAQVPGKVLSIAVKEGDRVEPGQKLLVIESMKMEFVVRAKAAGVVKRVLVALGDQVSAGTPLVEMGEAIGS